LPRTAGSIELSGIHLLPQVQRHGMGRAIIEGLKSQAAAAGIPLDLGVEKDNPDARRLYERLGSSTPVRPGRNSSSGGVHSLTPLCRRRLRDPLRLPSGAVAASAVARAACQQPWALAAGAPACAKPDHGRQGPCRAPVRAGHESGRAPRRQLAAHPGAGRLPLRPRICCRASVPPSVPGLATAPWSGRVVVSRRVAAARGCCR
jgi:hypothetical protein